MRGQGRGRALVSLAEDFAARELGARRLTLNVRTHNPTAYHCYLKCGFQHESQEGTRIRMSKRL